MLRFWMVSTTAQQQLLHLVVFALMTSPLHVPDKLFTREEMVTGDDKS
jgi:hypothetical protein